MIVGYSPHRLVIANDVTRVEEDPLPLPRIEVISSRLEDQRDYVLKPFYTVRVVAPTFSTHHGFSIDRGEMIKRAIEVQRDLGGEMPIIVDPFDDYVHVRFHPPEAHAPFGTCLEEPDE